MNFLDRADAGRQLAEQLAEYKEHPDVLVLGLPRGGVPVAHEVARKLEAPLDVFLVRKLGVPGHPELAMGAIAAGGVQVLSNDLIEQLGIPARVVEDVATRERLELDRRDAAFRSGRPPIVARDRTVIVIDDGLATGSTMEAAARALRQLSPAQIIVAAPVGARETCQRLGSIADRVICLRTPEHFNAVGQWYQNFSQTTDDEVIRLLGTPTRPGNGTKSQVPRRSLTETLHSSVRRLAGGPSDYNQLIEELGRARLVLLGEATHGSHEFYRERAVITRRLIQEKQVAAVAVEADWPDAYRVNRYVRGFSDDRSADEALGGFGRFPTWMWRNDDMVEFVEWLHKENASRPPGEQVGFYGLDLYSLRASMEAVLAYLEKVDPEGARRARSCYSCFDRFGNELQSYGYAATIGLHPSCERESVAQLLDLHLQRSAYQPRDGRIQPDEYFYAEQNARLVRNAEEYYRAMFRNRAESWNLRDRHMADTVRELLQFLERGGREGRIVVWAHNSHLGDARATDMHLQGELNVGELLREQFDGQAVAVGFTTFTGTVTAATEWDGPALRLRVRPALTGSYERLFHETGLPRFLAPLTSEASLTAALSAARLERAIGVVYAPDTEGESHYFRARLPEQFDYVVHVDETSAVTPLERTPLWETGEIQETYPFGL